jgi:hypothetical protein
MVRVVFLVVALVVVAGCNSVQRGPDGRVHLLSDGLRETIPTVTSWGDAVPPDRSSVDVAANRAELLRSLSPAEAALLRHDPRLDHIARVVAIAGSTTGQGVSDEVEAWLRWRLGVPQAFLQTNWGWASGNDRDFNLRSNLREWTRGLRLSSRARFGLARVLAGRRVGLSLVVVTDAVELEPFAQEVAVGSQLRLRGRLLEPIVRPRLYVLQPDGTTTNKLLTPAADGSFDEVVAWRGRGRAFLEMRGGLPGVEPEHRARSLIHIPIGVGEPAQRTERDEFERIGATPEAGVSAVSVAALFEGIRADAGLALWTRSEDLDAAACARDEAMSKEGALEASPYPPPLPPSIADARWGTFRSLADVKWQLATSPSFRELLRDPADTHLALCAARVDDKTRLRVLVWKLGATAQTQPADTTGLHIGRLSSGPRPQ